MNPPKLAVALLAAAIPALTAGDFRDPSLPVDARASDLVSRLTLAEKISFITTIQPAIPRLGIEARNIVGEALHGVARISDRSGTTAGTSYQTATATVFPQAIGLAHTWDPDLIRAVASAIGDEARVFHNDPSLRASLLFFSPVVDLARDPRWGRTEESYGEDPYLNSMIGGAFVHGMQGDDPAYYETIPTLKHFAANSTENNRQSASSNVDPRNLHEYYLKPFERITRDEHVQSIMVAYNAINDLPCAVTNLVRDLVRGDWGFNGAIVTDSGDLASLVNNQHYVSTTAEAAAAIVKAGMDSILDDLGAAPVQVAIDQGLLTEADLDQALRRMFRVRFLTGEFDPPERVPYNTIPSSALMSTEHTALARRVGRESVVLLKNSQQVLPLDASRLRNIAVIGPRANEVERDWYTGNLPYKVTPLDGIRARLGPGAQVLFHEGTSKIALRSRYNNLYVTAGPSGTSALTAASASAGTTETFLKEDLGWGCTTLRSAVNGRYITSTNSQGLFYASVEDAYAWSNLFCFFFEERSGGGTRIRWQPGLQPYYLSAQGTGGTLFLTPNANSAAIGFDVIEVENGVQQAAAVAAQADVAVVVVGNNTTINGMESKDRPDIILPPPQDQLIQAVYQANPNTVVVLVSSYPNTMNWADAHVPAILYTSHGGPELGNFLADVLFGDTNPAGRLTMTWFKSAADIPPIEDYDIRKGRTYWYFPGEPLYPFGYGLSYTSFAYRNLTVTPGDPIAVSVDVQNSGFRAGDEVVQLYTHARNSKVQRPIAELKRFQRITLQPGETRTVRFSLPLSETAFWDVRRSRFTVEKGTLEIQAGASSRDIRLHGEVVVDGEALAPRNAFEVLRAENYDDYSGVLLTRAGDGTQAARSIHTGDWLAFREVDFGLGASGMEARIASGGAGGTIEVHLDSAGGTAAGSCAVPATGGWYTWTTITCPGVEASGLHDVFLVFGGSGDALFNLNWFRFASSSEDAPALEDGGAVDAAAFTQPLLRGSWGAAFGRNLASTTRGWALSDFSGFVAPTSLEGTRVAVNGIAAAVSFVSPGQVNFQVPGSVNIGDGVVQVMTAAGASRPIRAAIDEAQPEFFAQVLGGRNWITAQHANYSRICLPELAPPATPAAPLETIILWGSGFGQTWPPISSGLLLSVPLPAADPGGVSLTIGGHPATIQYVGMTMAGVYQLNVVVPDLPDGDYPVVATAGGRQTKVPAYLPVRR